MFAVRPKGNAVDWLATECRKLRKHNVAFLFPFAVLKKWIPPYAENLRSKVSVMRCTRVSAWRASVPLQDESSEDGIVSMALWQLAFEKFALGAAMVQSGGEVLSVCNARARFCCSE